MQKKSFSDKINHLSYVNLHVVSMATHHATLKNGNVPIKCSYQSSISS